MLWSIHTFCLAVLQGVQAIVDTLPAVRRLRWGTSPPLPEPPPPPPPAAPLAPPLVAGVALPVLESLNLVEEEEENSVWWFEGAKERSPDISCSMITRLNGDTCRINFLWGREWGLYWMVKAEEETVKVDRRGATLKHANLYHDR